MCLRHHEAACRKRKNDDDTIPKWVTSAVPPLDQTDSLSASVKDAARWMVLSLSPAKEVLVSLGRWIDMPLPDQYVTQYDSTALRDLRRR